MATPSRWTDRVVVGSIDGNIYAVSFSDDEVVDLTEALTPKDYSLMAIRMLIHFVIEDAVPGERDGMPDPAQAFIRVRNVTRINGKQLDLVDNRTTSVAYPWSCITYVELFNNEETARESDLGFFL